MIGFNLPQVRFPPPEEQAYQWTKLALRPLISQQSENMINAILKRITEVQARLTPEQELVVFCSTAAGTIRVLAFQFPSWNVAIISGLDTDKNEAEVITHVQSIQLTCKVQKREPGVRPITIGFTLPPEEETK
jgi:hypothetical protein